MAFSVVTDETFQVETCCNCGVRFAMTDAFYRKRLENLGPNNPFYCPNGHKQWYVGKTEADKLRDENAKLKDTILKRDNRIDALHEQRQQVEHRLRATKGVVTKIKKRISHGVCPCCNRTFDNLARHMSSQHPTYAAEAAE